MQGETEKGREMQIRKKGSKWRKEKREERTGRRKLGKVREEERREERHGKKKKMRKLQNR